MKTFVGMSWKLDVEFNTLYDSSVASCAHALESEVKDDAILDQRVAGLIKRLWANRGIRMTYQLRSLFQLCDSAAYFFERVEALCRDDYCPSFEDVLHVRARTRGVVEARLTLDGRDVRLVDVGGQRQERKRWFQCFDGVTAVLFVAAMSEYDQVCFEDGVTNRLQEALEVFSEICNSRWFRQTLMILLLSKEDVLREKLRYSPLSECFPEFKGGTGVEAAKEFIKAQFLAKNEYPSKKHVHVHFMTAIDSESVASVFEQLKPLILQRAQQRAAAGLD